ncbi:MAG: prephenate dehydrogenase [Lachnospiraceae bacterium]|nr:prephenate dehydrogenase [Lachnospiraceae bacterium]
MSGKSDFEHACFGMIGLGLIGGSIAKALRNTYPECTIYAFNPSQDTLEQAAEEGVINRGFQKIGPEFRDCGYVFLCAPVADNAANIAAVAPYLSPDAILTDIGSTKQDIHDHIRSFEGGRLAPQFIGGHPMTGSERTRYRNSRASLLENAYYILTPEEEVPAEKTEEFRTLIASLKAIPLVLDCSRHDYAVAAISHLPHVISASLVNLVRASDGEDGLLKLIAAGGFRDLTRISSSSPVMWQQICLTNRDNILSLLEQYIGVLTDFAGKISGGDAAELYDFFANARMYRDSFITGPSGPIRKVYSLYVDIADRPGVIADVATILAQHGVNIKNLGITHNREYQEGVLRVELPDAASADLAVRTLQDGGYTVHPAAGHTSSIAEGISDLVRQHRSEETGKERHS